MRKIILDCDPGMDDSMAIIMAAKSPALELIAITTVAGNYPVEVTSVNACKTLELIGRAGIPVARGMEKPLVRQAPRDPFTHGRDGQAEAFLPAPAKKLDSRNAVDLIIEEVRKNPGEIYLISTAPMTNLAAAMEKDPGIKPLIPGIIAISGAFGLNSCAFLNATGGTPQSEWNVFVDPEAAQAVYQSGVPLTAIGLDIAANFDVDFSDQDCGLLKNSSRPEAAFLMRAIDFTRGRGYQAYTAVIDCLAVAYAIDPTLIHTIEGRVGVETHGEISLGMTIYERRLHHGWESLPIIRIGDRADFPRFIQMIMDAIQS